MRLFPGGLFLHFPFVVFFFFFYASLRTPFVTAADEIVISLFQFRVVCTTAHLNFGRRLVYYSPR